MGRGNMGRGHMGRSNSGNQRLAGNNRNGLLGFDEIANVTVGPASRLAVVKHGDETSRIGLELTFDKDDEVALFVCDLLPTRITPDDFGSFTTIGISDKKTKKLIAGAVYHRWRKFDCELTFAAADPKWCRKGVLAALFHYPFVQRHLNRMTLIIGSNNKRAIKLNLGLGFRLEGVARKAYDGFNDAIILGMLREECKWIKETK